MALDPSTTALIQTLIPPVVEVLGLALALAVFWLRKELNKTKKSIEIIEDKAVTAQVAAAHAKTRVDRIDSDMDELDFRNGDRGLQWFRRMAASAELTKDQDRQLKELHEKLDFLYERERQRVGS